MSNGVHNISIISITLMLDFWATVMQRALRKVTEL